MTKVMLSPAAAEWLSNAEPPVREQMRKRLHLAGDDPEHFLSSLTNSPYYRLRAGNYRALIDWDRKDDVLLVLAIDHRRSFYD